MKKIRKIRILDHWCVIMVTDHFSGRVEQSVCGVCVCVSGQ